MAGAPELDIEITEAMISAAAAVLLRDPFAGDHVIGGEALAEEMLRAALAQRRSEKPASDP